jgi:hypothetical protein
MVTSTSKHDITKEKYKHCMLKTWQWKEINHDRKKFKQRHNNDDVIDYWHEDFQLSIIDENIFLNPCKWLNDQHMVATMQMLYVKKLES